MAALFFCLCPGPLMGYSMLGFGDYHVMEALLALGIGFGLYQLLREAEGSFTRFRAFLCGLPLGLFFLTWPGSAIHLLATIVCLALVGVALVSRSQSPAPLFSLAGRVWHYGTTQLVFYGVITALIPDAVITLQNHALICLGLLGLALFLPGLLCCLAGARWPSSPGQRWLSVGALSLVAVVLALIASHPAVRELLGYAFHQRTELIGEHPRAPLKVLLHSFGPVIVLAALGLYRLSRNIKPNRLPGFGFGLMALLYFLLWWKTADFSYLCPAFLAVLAPLGLKQCQEALPEIHPKLFLPLALAALFGQILSGQLAPLTLAPQSLSRLRLMHDGWRQSMTWLAAETPAPVRPVNTQVQSTDYPIEGYGVVTPWDFGQFIVALGQRPSAFTQTLNQELASWWVSEDEDSFYRSLVLRRLKYVVTESRLAGDFFPAKVMAAGLNPEDYSEAQDTLVFNNQPYPLRTYGQAYRRTMMVRLHLDAGSGLERLRLVYESPKMSLVSYVGSPMVQNYSPGLKVNRRTFWAETPGDLEDFKKLSSDLGPAQTPLGFLYGGEMVPAVRIFERVKGAVLQGTTKPGQQVEVRLVLTSRTSDTPIIYENQTQADETGRFTLRVPYPTHSFPSSAVTAAGPYTLVSGPTRRSVQVSELQVQTGTVFPLGSLVPQSEKV